MSGFQQFRSSPIVLTFLLALAGNFVWEMAQMYAYSSFFVSTSAMLLSCSRAAAGDAIFIAALYWLGRKLTHERNWTSRRLWRRLPLAVGASLIVAVAMEAVAQKFGMWHYSEAMPVFPGLDVGLWPILQLPILTITTFAIVGRIR